MWIWGDYLERPGLGAVAMGCWDLTVGWDPTLHDPS